MMQDIVIIHIFLSVINLKYYSHDSFNLTIYQDLYNILVKCVYFATLLSNIFIKYVYIVIII